MLVHVNVAEPYKKDDGSWDLKEYETNEEVPDLGRHDVLCNKCGWSTYPECKKWCRNARLDKK